MNTLRSLAAACLLAALPGPLPAQTQGADLPSVADLFAPDAWGKSPDQLAWAPDGESLGFLWDDGHGDALWTLAPGGTPERRLALADLAAAGEKAPSLDAYSWLPDGSGWLVTAGGDLYLAPLGSAARRLTKTPAEESEAAVSPKGDRASFVRGHDLFAIDLKTGRETRLTRGGRENETLNGETDWVYWEEIWNRDATGSWWAPDGRRIAYYHFDERPVSVYPLIDDVPKNATVRWQKDPLAGEPNPLVTIGVLDVATKKTVWMATGGDRDGYLARAAWSIDGSWLAIERLNRDQTELDLLRCLPKTGKCSVLASDRDPDWINLGDEFRPLPDGRFLWSSEREGYRRLYLHARDGHEIAAVTPPGWALASLDAVEPDWTTFTAYSTTEPLGAAERHVFRVRPDGSGVERMTTGRGWHAALVAKKTGWWVDIASDADTPSRQRMFSSSGETDLPGKAPAVDPGRYPKWEFLTIPGPDGSRLPARLLKPAGFDPSKRYPAVVYHYGGPASQVIVDRFGSRDAWHKWMAARGYASFSVDNQASLFFGKKGEVKVHRRFGELELAGQLAGVEFLKTLGWVDTARLGLWGWSGGGSNTLYALLNRPGVWKAGVAGAPVTDWRLYDSIWTERYLERPQDNEEGYRLSSPLTHAASLTDRLLVVHGTADDNVHPQNTWNLIRALQKAKVPYEDMALPGQSHGVKGDALIAFYRRMTEFFDRELEPGKP